MLAYLTFIGILTLEGLFLFNYGPKWAKAINDHKYLRDSIDEEDLKKEFGLSEFFRKNKPLAFQTWLFLLGTLLIIVGFEAPRASYINTTMEGTHVNESSEKEELREKEILEDREEKEVVVKEQELEQKKEDEANIQKSMSEFRDNIENR